MRLTVIGVLDVKYRLGRTFSFFRVLPLDLQVLNLFLVLDWDEGGY